MTELWCVSARALNLKKVRSLLKFDITNDRIMVSMIPESFESTRRLIRLSKRKSLGIFFFSEKKKKKKRNLNWIFFSF